MQDTRPEASAEYEVVFCLPVFCLVASKSCTQCFLFLPHHGLRTHHASCLLTASLVNFFSSASQRDPLTSVITFPVGVRMIRSLSAFSRRLPQHFLPPPPHAHHVEAPALKDDQLHGILSVVARALPSSALRLRSCESPVAQGMETPSSSGHVVHL